MKLAKFVSRTLGLLIVIPAVVQIHGQENTVSVKVQGIVQAKPDTATLTASLSASGETAVESAQAYQQKLTLLNELFDPMEYRDIQMKIGKVGLSLHNHQHFAVPMGFGEVGGAVPFVDAEEAAPQFHSRSSVEFKIKLDAEMTESKVLEHVDKIAGLIESSEIELDSSNYDSTLIAFNLVDRQKHMDAALGKGIEEAKRKASLIADLTNRRLGNVITVHESGFSISGSNSPHSGNFINQQYFPVSSLSLNTQPDEITLTVALEVVFELAD